MAKVCKDERVRVTMGIGRKGNEGGHTWAYMTSKAGKGELTSVSRWLGVSPPTWIVTRAPMNSSGEPSSSS